MSLVLVYRLFHCFCVMAISMPVVKDYFIADLYIYQVILGIIKALTENRH